MIELGGVRVETVEPADWAPLAGHFAGFNYEQSVDYAADMATRSGSSARFCAVRDGDEILGAAAVRVKTLPLLSRGIAYVSGGPLAQFTGDEWSPTAYEIVLNALRAEFVDRQGPFFSPDRRWRYHKPMAWATFLLTSVFAPRPASGRTGRSQSVFCRSWKPNAPIWLASGAPI